jgi:D-alanyl-D-alanine carboxypeptidase/D-alanyl-D-alanine-endopeptidase (penicillin-binding protein 4)
MLPRFVSVVPLLLAGLCSLARADLSSDIRAILQDKYLAKSEIGISIVRVDGKPSESASVFKHDSDIPLLPASNLKLLTTSAALDRLGPDFKFRTFLLQKDQDLYLIGDGDPTIGDIELLKKTGWGTTTLFRLWADELKKRHITKVNKIFVDDSVFDQQFLHPDWSPRYANARYSAEVAGMNLNANCVDFLVRLQSAGQPVTYLLDPPTQYVSVRNTCISGRRGGIALSREAGGNEINLRGEAEADSTEPISITIHDPALFAATVLKETLASAGITVSGPISRDPSARRQFEASQAGWTLIAALATPISTVLARANKDSMNLYAECLCKRLGYASTGRSGSWASGTAAVAAFLRRLGVDDSQFHLDDGCGLSRKNNVSPAAVTAVLASNFHSRNKDVFCASLGIAGVDGTLKDRFAKSDLRERILAKSGYIDAVSALSGYLHTKDGRWYAFSILMNNLPLKTNNTAKQIQERIVTAIDRNS